MAAMKILIYLFNLHIVFYCFLYQLDNIQHVDCHENAKTIGLVTSSKLVSAVR